MVDIALQEAEKPKPETNPDWMSSLAADTTLDDIIWPGTHDSGAYCEQFDYSKVVCDERSVSWGTRILNYSPGCLKTFVSKWTRAQKLNISEQLQHGTRYLDLRVAKCPSDAVYYIFHSFCGPRLDHVLQEIVTFMEQNTKECLMIEVTPRSFVDHGELSNLIENKFNRLLLRKDPQYGNVSPFLLKLSHLQENGRIIVFYNLSFSQRDTTLPSAFWDSKYLCAPWQSTLDPEDNQSFEINRYDLFNSVHESVDLGITLTSSTSTQTEFESSVKQMFHFKYALTPTFKQIVRSLLPRSNLSNLEQCASKINPHLRKHFENIQKINSQGVIFSIDYIEQSELVQIAIQANKESRNN